MSGFFFFLLNSKILNTKLCFFELLLSTFNIQVSLLSKKIREKNKTLQLGRSSIGWRWFFKWQFFKRMLIIAVVILIKYFTETRKLLRWIDCHWIKNTQFIFSFLLLFVEKKLYFYRAADDNFKSEKINIQHIFTNELCALFK